MAYEFKEGDISVFPKEKTKDNQPDWTGKAMIDGKMRSISLWKKNSQLGEFLSGKVQDFVSPKTGQAREAYPAKTQNQNVRKADELEDEIPF